MGVYIKGMEMPEHCGYCRFRYDGICHALQKTQYSMEECPLVPVPPHGDLIDLKAPFKAQYYDEMTEEWLEKIVTVEDVLCGCMVDEMPPTILEAEEGEI